MADLFLLQQVLGSWIDALDGRMAKFFSFSKCSAVGKMRWMVGWLAFFSFSKCSAVGEMRWMVGWLAFFSFSKCSAVGERTGEMVASATQRHHSAALLRINHTVFHTVRQLALFKFCLT